jgi:UDP-GlcNAc3NAcA epimerase
MREFAQRPEMLKEDIDQFMVCTFHRPSNTDDQDNLEQIISALNELHEKVIPIVLPLHPRTKSALEKSGMQLNVHTIDPVGYLEMLWLLDNSSLVLTDSGGLQKEAFFFEKPCVTMRDQTEWIELIDIGANVLTGADKVRIISAVKDMMGRQINDNGNLYGRGCASECIADVLEELFVKNA